MRATTGLVGCGVFAASLLAAVLAGAVTQASDSRPATTSTGSATGVSTARNPAERTQAADPPASAGPRSPAPAEDAHATSSDADETDPAAAPPLAAPILLDGGERPEQANGSADPGRASASPPRPAGPISSSLERHVEKVVRIHQEPCAQAGAEGTPCFPVTVEEEGPEFSVEESVKNYKPDDRPAPGVPTVAEIQQQMTGAPRSASGGVSGDPVCAAKSLVRELRGGSNTFFLYRLVNEGVERPLLTDHKLDLLTYAAVPGARLEFVGEFTGECAAVAAWRKALRNANEPDEEERQADRPHKRAP